MEDSLRTQMFKEHIANLEKINDKISNRVWLMEALSYLAVSLITSIEHIRALSYQDRVILNVAAMTLVFLAGRTLSMIVILFKKVDMIAVLVEEVLLTVTEEKEGP